MVLNGKVDILITYLRTNLIDNVLKLAKKNAGIKNKRINLVPYHNEKIEPFAVVMNRLVESSQNQYVCVLADDTSPGSKYLKNALKAMNTFPDNWGLVMMNDGTGIDRPSHFVFDRRVLKLLDGKICNEEYFHCCSDLEMIDRLRESKRYIYAKNSLVIHNHPMLNSNCKSDKYYEMWYDEDKRKIDQELYNKRRANNWK